MKVKSFIVIFMALIMASCSQYKVYSVKQSPLMPVNGGVVYALPKTQLCIAVTVERRDVSAAPYYKYSTDYLGIAEESIDTLFHIVNVEVNGVNVADADNYYYVNVRRGSLTVDHRHLLLAIGMENPSGNTEHSFITQNIAAKESVASRGEYNLYDRADTFYTRQDAPGRPSLVLSKKDVRNTGQRAQSAAERIGEIQERMQQLLNGEYEGSYGAEAVGYLYEKLKTQEEELLSEFCGKVKRETVCFYVEPVMKRKEDFIDTVIWFSESFGFVGDEDHLPPDAFPIVCEVHHDNDLRVVGRFVKYHSSGVTQNGNAGRTGSAAAKNKEVKGFRYRVPEQALVTVTTPVFSVSRQVAISQLGPTVSLPCNRVKALFDANTLDLKYFGRK